MDNGNVKVIIISRNEYMTLQVDSGNLSIMFSYFSYFSHIYDVNFDAWETIAIESASHRLHGHPITVGESSLLFLISDTGALRFDLNQGFVFRSLYDV